MTVGTAHVEDVERNSTAAVWAGGHVP